MRLYFNYNRPLFGRGCGKGVPPAASHICGALPLYGRCCWIGSASSPRNLTRARRRTRRGCGQGVSLIRSVRGAGCFPKKDRSGAAPTPSDRPHKLAGRGRRATHPTDNHCMLLRLPVNIGALLRLGTILASVACSCPEFDRTNGLRRSMLGVWRAVARPKRSTEAVGPCGQKALLEPHWSAGVIFVDGRIRPLASSSVDMLAAGDRRTA